MKLTIGYQALLALILGILCGLFFGPYCSLLEPIGKGFVMLLQMVVLPYIPFLLIHGLGSLSPQLAKKLFKRGWFFLLILWGFVLSVIYLLALLTPEPVTSFVEKSSSEPHSLATEFLNFVVPQNLFYDLANNVVPAIAIFGVIIGAAIMHLEHKEPLLTVIARFNEALDKILQWLAYIAPLALFAHVAVAVGTVNFTDLLKLEFYVVCFILGTLFLTFWVLPAFLTSMTKMSYREVIEEFRTVCLLAFLTGLPSLIFPFIGHPLRKIAKDHHIQGPGFYSTSQTVMPLSYSFAQIGNFFILFFILFMSFFYRHALEFGEKILLPILSIPLSFGTSVFSINAVTFLIKELSFPDRAADLYEQVSSITRNFQVLLSAASVLTFVILVLHSYYGLLKIRWNRLLLNLSLPFILLTGGVLIAKHFVHLEDNFSELYMKLKIEAVIPDPVEVRIYEPGEAIPPRTTDLPIDRVLGRILQSGILRVGYDTRNIPFCYRNDSGELCGYDVAFAYQLARDLDCKLEFIPLDLDLLAEQLDRGLYDIAMAAIIMDEQRIAVMDFSQPYFEQDNVLVVPTTKRDQFLDLETVAANANLTLTAFGAYRAVAHRHFPKAQVLNGTVDDLIIGQADGSVWSYIPAFIWCLTHPQFTVIDYDYSLGRKYFSYPFSINSYHILDFINDWLELKKQSGFTDMQLRYWLHGEPPASDEPRWSLLRNTLHWID